MTTQEISKKFAELISIPVCDLNYAQGFCNTHGVLVSNVNKFDHIPKDYCADPRLVLEVMMKRADWMNFLGFLRMIEKYIDVDFFITEYILDTTGKLALAAIKYLEKKK